MKQLIKGIATLLVLVSFVFAASPHFKRAPMVVDNGITATATGAVAGLGNGNVLITLSFPNATGTTVCTNPGGNQTPGQNPATPVNISGTALFTSIKNGNLAFTVTTDPPSSPTPEAAGCPNGRWTATFDNITFGTGTLTVAQESFPGSGIFVPVLTTSVSLP